MMFRFGILVAIVFGAQQLFCQYNYPPSDLLLFNWSIDQEVSKVDFVQSLSSNDNKLYTNQPYFFNDSMVYYNQIKELYNTTDIYTINIENLLKTQATNTPGISEFSPQPHPDGISFTVVRIEEDGKTQTLWSYPIEKFEVGHRIIPWIDNIGYYIWLNNAEIMAFLVDSTHQLKRLHIFNKSEELISLNPGRALKKKNAEEYLFLDKSKRDNFILKSYHTTTRQIKYIMNWPFLTDDFDVVADKFIIASSENILFSYNLDLKDDWTKLLNIEELGYKSITRISSHPSGKIILVAHK